MGVADYLNTASTDPVVVKVETGLDNDFFVGFNRAVGVNSQNDEGDDVVTVIQVDGGNGDTYSQSYLKAKLGFSGDITGSSYTITDFGGTGVPLTISVDAIDLGTTPATATVNFHYGEVQADCSQITHGNTCKNTSGCIWESKTCKLSAPSPPTTPAPAPAPTLGGCSANSCSSCGGRGECRDAGCSWAKGRCS